jgi:isoleucyl-tRNA synthetase
MPFREVPTKVDFPAQEREILEFWKTTQAFQKMREIHKGKPHWSFIDGPITANNPNGCSSWLGAHLQRLVSTLLDDAWA